jgi:ankyrin repeat protein
VGEGGWSAIHYAVYCARKDVLEELLQRKVELNRCTVDGWLPLQLAVHRHNYELLKMLLEEDRISIN